MEESRSTVKMLTGKCTENRLLGRPRHRWEGSIKIYLKEIGVDT